MSKANRRVINPIKAGASPHFREGRVRGIPDFLVIDRKRIRPFHEATRYGYTVGLVRSLEIRMLNTQRVERMIEADLEGALYILEEIPIGDYLQGAESIKDIDDGVNTFLASVYESVEQALPGNSLILDFFLCRYDFHNLKALLKGSKEGREAPGLILGFGRIGVDRLRDGISDPGSLPSPYKETVYETAQIEGDAQIFDAIVDRKYFEHRLFLAWREDNPFMVDFARASIDLANLKQLLRARLLSKERDFLDKTLISGGFVPVASLMDLYADPSDLMIKKLQSNIYYSRLLSLAEDVDEAARLTDFDRRTDDRLMEMVRETKKISVGAEPIFAYIKARENEAMMVRLILVAKVNQMDPASIDKMIRQLYIE